VKAKILQHWNELRASYWFIPTLMTIAAIVLSFVTLNADDAVGSHWIYSVSWLYADQPQGARSLLSTVAESMIGVAGVTFSITIASVSYMTSQFGPRLLTNFMRDRGNQITLGTFIATFVYCILVLRTIHGSNSSGELSRFVPHISILCALLLALASLAVLIYFIHHIPESILIQNVIADIGGELNRQIERVFPEQSETDHAPGQNPSALPDDFLQRSRPVYATGNGYVQNLVKDDLLEPAAEHDLLLRLDCEPGDFVSKGKLLGLAYPAERIDDTAIEKVLGAFAWGAQRTQSQDTLFLVQELVEIAARALSPGINDPFTATSCMDWLQSALSNLAGRQLEEQTFTDQDGTVRIYVQPLSFTRFADQIFDKLRPYFSDDRNAAINMMHAILQIIIDAERESDRAVLLTHAEALLAACRQHLDHPRDIDPLERLYQRSVRLANRRASGKLAAEKAN
jgi:uncharacterized membrane protein